MDLHLGTDVAMTFSCHSCGAVSSVLRVNGSPKVFTCSGCRAVYEISVKRIKPPQTDKRIVKGEEWVRP
jgi:transcription elongation factor Elf1